MNLQSLKTLFSKLRDLDAKMKRAPFGSVKIPRVNPSTGYVIPPGNGSVDALGYGPGDPPRPFN